jgi:uncharacterized protein YllA (UPF0747 family)
VSALRFEDVAPDAALFLALVRGREPMPATPSLAAAVAAASARDLPRETLTRALIARLEELGAPSASLASAERLRRPGVVAVVAGQQPVLFGGPHLVVSKALAAVAVARRIEAGGTPAVPVFWVASEDHDHAEVDHVDVVRPAGGTERLSVTLPDDRRMLSRVPLDADAALARLAEILPPGPGRDEALAAVRPAPGDSVGSAFARTLLRLLGRFGIVVVEPETLRPFARAVAAHDVAHPGDLARVVVAAEDAFAAHGFAKPLGLRVREVFFVADRAGRRHRPQGLPEADDAAGIATWLRRIDEKPESVSWNVAGRVLAQDVALPVAAQVCGPAEFGYCAAIAPAHALLGVPAPALVPRPGVTFVDRGFAPAGADGGLQERSLSILPFLAAHGSGILDGVLAAVSPEGAEHEVIPLGGA